MRSELQALDKDSRCPHDPIALAPSPSPLIFPRARRSGWGRNYYFCFIDVETEAHISDLYKVTKLDWNLGLQGSIQPVGVAASVRRAGPWTSVSSAGHSVRSSAS